MVDTVAPYHATFTEAMRRTYGKVLAKGLPRITRYRPGATRFTLVDPSGNSLIFIQRDEPVELEYGGARELEGLPRALDNARIFREFKNDDRGAVRTLVSAPRQYHDAPAVDRALAHAMLVELSIALGETDRERVAAELAHADQLTSWLTPAIFHHSHSDPSPNDQ